MDKSETLDAFLERSPYIRFLGMTARLEGELLTACLPYRKRLIGNPMIPALHGGVIGAFMEMTAVAQLAVAEPSRRMPKTIDVTIEYLRPGKPQDLFARADLRKVGRRIANVHVECWQESPETPVAALRGHFLLRNES
jgi:uncharacterized protein (TIGR00369 family)